MIKPWTLGLLLLLPACSDTPHGPITYQVTYQLSGSAGITFDSVRYENTQGALVKVAAPSSGWFVAFSAMTGSYVQADAWTVASNGGASAKLKVTWTVNGVSTGADSSMATAAAPGAFTLVVSRRRL